MNAKKFEYKNPYLSAVKIFIAQKNEVGKKYDNIEQN